MPDSKILAQAVTSALKSAGGIHPLKSAAFFLIPEKGGPELLAVAGDDSPARLKRLTSAVESIASGNGFNDSADSCKIIVCTDVLSSGNQSCVAVCDTDTEITHESAGAISEILQMTLHNALLNQELEKARIIEERRHEQLSAISEIGQSIHTLSPIEILEFICRKAADVMQAHACSLLLKNDDEELVIKASFGLPEEVVQKTHLPRGYGVAWHVADTGAPMLLNESPKEQIGDLSVPHRTDIQSSMCVPLRTKDGPVLGVLSIRRMIPSAEFTVDDLDLFSIFAGQAALFVSNAELYAKLQRRIQEMSTINRLTAAINSTLDLDYVLSQIAECVTDEMKFDRCVVYLTDQRNNGLESRVSRGENTNEGYPVHIQGTESVIGLCAREQVVIHQEAQQAEMTTDSNGEFCCRTGLVAAPIVVRKKTIGVIAADNSPSGLPVDHAQIDLLSTFVDHAGMAIENSSLYEAMEQKYSELNALYDLSKTIGSAYGLNNAVELLLDVALKAMPDACAALALVDEDQDEVTLQATRQKNETNPVSWQITEEVEAARLLCRLKETTLLPDPELKDQKWGKVFSRIVESGNGLLFIPLRADGQSVGVLMLSRDETIGFSPDDIKLLTIIASHASVVIKNAATYERRMQERVLELSALYRLSQRISSARNLTEALNSIVAIASDLVDCDECLVWTLDQDTESLTLRASLNARTFGMSPMDKHLAGDEELANWVLHERKAIMLPDIQQDSRFASLFHHHSHIRSLMSIPLMLQDEVVGVMTVQSHTPSAFTDDQARVLSVIAFQAAAIFRGLQALTALSSYTDKVLTSIPVGVVSLDRNETILSWNRAAGQILKQIAGEALGRKFSEILDSCGAETEDISLLNESVQSVLFEGGYQRGISVTLGTSEEESLHLTFSISQIEHTDADETGVVVVFEDITQQVQMQEEVLRMSELAAIGQLAASIAHELRNPLSSIKGAAQFLQADIKDDSTSEFLGIILEEVDGLNKIASQFLDFARPLKLEITELHPRIILEKEVGLLAHQLDQADIAVNIRIDDNVPMIMADETQMEQVVLNLMLNSIQAMPGGGELSLVAKRSQAWPECVEIIIRDNGCGIPADRLGKIFTPFFTTKIKGTGLGLSVVQKIVHNHQGHILVESEEGEGASFHIHLPIKGPKASLLGEQPLPAPDLLERT